MLDEIEKQSKAILGWRSWKVDDSNTLNPLNSQYFSWKPGVNEAFCSLKNRGGRLHGHSSPDESCECGLYAYHHPNPNWNAEHRDPFIFGLVVGKGKTEIHEAGFRSAEMQIVVLVWTGFQNESVLHEVGEKYDVDLYSMNEALQVRKDLIDSGKAISFDSIDNDFTYIMPRRTYNRSGKLHSFKDKPSVVDFMGNKFWHRKGLLHREDDKPAAVYLNRIGYLHGISNQTSYRPAYVVPDCHKVWYQKGFVHRDNGLPAIIRANGAQEWWRKGKKYRSTSR